MEEMTKMANWMGCDIGDFPFTYLRLSIGVNMRRVKAWEPVVEKFKKRLADWKAKTMSDKWSWSLREDGEFKVKDLSRMLEDKILHTNSEARETRWNKLVPKKVNVFV
ncbi:hypothetical protein Tco_0660388 [Tanacetum coccineum]